MVVAVTIESVLLVLVIVGAIAGVIGFRVYVAKRRVSQWRKGHGPGHESFFELPYNRDQVFQVAQEVLARDYQVSRVTRVERLLLGEKHGVKGRVERVTVRVDPTLQGCELLFNRLGPGWKSVPAGSNGPEAEHFFNAVSTMLAPHLAPAGHQQHPHAGGGIPPSQPGVAGAPPPVGAPPHARPNPGATPQAPA